MDSILNSITTRLDYPSRRSTNGEYYNDRCSNSMPSTIDVPPIMIHAPTETSDESMRSNPDFASYQTTHSNSMWRNDCVDSSRLYQDYRPMSNSVSPLSSANPLSSPNYTTATSVTTPFEVSPMSCYPSSNNSHHKSNNKRNSNCSRMDRAASQQYLTPLHFTNYPQVRANSFDYPTRDSFRDRSSQMAKSLSSSIPQQSLQPSVNSTDINFTDSSMFTDHDSRILISSSSQQQPLFPNARLQSSFNSSPSVPEDYANCNDISFASRYLSSPISNKKQCYAHSGNSFDTSPSSQDCSINTRLVNFQFNFPGNFNNKHHQNHHFDSMRNDLMNSPLPPSSSNLRPPHYCVESNKILTDEHGATPRSNDIIDSQILPFQQQRHASFQDRILIKENNWGHASPSSASTESVHQPNQWSQSLDVPALPSSNLLIPMTRTIPNTTISSSSSLTPFMNNAIARSPHSSCSPALDITLLEKMNKWDRQDTDYKKNPIRNESVEVPITAVGCDNEVITCKNNDSCGGSESESGCGACGDKSIGSSSSSTIVHCSQPFYSARQDKIDYQSGSTFFKTSARSIKKHICSFCFKSFTRPSSLQTHIYSHTGEKPFLCDHKGCGRRFSVVSNLRRHKRIHSMTFKDLNTREQ